MIPKIIHYIWFGRGEMPQMALNCIESWKKLLPDYELMLWNEDNFDININQYTREAYENKKYAFVSDYARLYALYHYGGIYMDTDVEVIKPLDRFLEHEAFSGFENPEKLQTGLIGAEKNNEWIKIILDEYENRRFVDQNGNLDFTPNTITISNISKKYGFKQNNKLQKLSVGGVVIYPDYFFCPYNAIMGIDCLCEDSYTIHHFASTWLPKHKQIRNVIIRYVGKIFGLNTIKFIRKMLNKQ